MARDFLPDRGTAGGPNIGLIGGTFDPIHIGHLVSAEEARQQFDLAEVIFIPAGYPPHKERQKITPPEHRYLMASLAVISNPHFSVSRVEIDREQPSYTIDTLQYFKESAGQAANLFLITGADAILDILAWKSYDRLLDLCTMIAVSRPGYSFEKLRETVGSQFPSFNSKVRLLEMPGLAISSSLIRERVAGGRTIKYLTPEPVEQYIGKHGLYRK